MEAMNLCYEMHIVRLELDGVAIASLLTACANLGALDQGRWLHFYMLNNGVHMDKVIGCALVNMYLKMAPWQGLSVSSFGVRLI